MMERNILHELAVMARMAAQNIWMPTEKLKSKRAYMICRALVSGDRAEISVFHQDWTYANKVYRDE